MSDYNYLLLFCLFPVISLFFTILAWWTRIYIWAEWTKSNKRKKFYIWPLIGIICFILWGAMLAYGLLFFG